MTAVITGLVGLVGVLVGVVLSFFLQHRLWQRQEATKAYARLFGLWTELRVPWNKVASMASIDSLQGAKERYEKDYRPVHWNLLLQVKHCWMLERNPAVRSQVEHVEQVYEEESDLLYSRLQMNADAFGDLLQELGRKRAGTWARINDEFDNLRKTVAEKHFHSGPLSGDAQAEPKEEE